MISTFFFQDSARTKDPPLRHPVTLCVICDYTGGLIFRKVVGGGDFRAARSFFVNIFLVGIFFPYTMVDHLMVLWTDWSIKSRCYWSFASIKS